MVIAALIAAAAALIGAAIASGDEAKAQGIRMKLAEDVKSIPLPQLDKLVAQKLPPEAVEKYSQVTQSTQAQSDVLGKYMQEVNSKGETADDRAAYLRMRQEAGGIANSAQSAVQRGMSNRGMAGSGLSVAMQEQGAQSAANAANAAGVNEASQARGRYMSALGQAGQLSGQMRGQELQSMSAADAINMFNARQQSAADAANQRLPQQQFDNRMEKQNAVSNAQNGVAAGYQREGDAARQTAGGVGQAAITAGATYDQFGSKKPSDSGPDGAQRTLYDEYGNPIGGQDW